MGDHATWQHRAARALTAAYAFATVVAVGRVVFGRHAAGWHGPDWHDVATLWDLLFGVLNIPVAASFLSVVVLYLTTRALVGRKRIGLLLVGLFQLAGVAIGVLAVLPWPLIPELQPWRPRGPVGRGSDIAGAIVGLAVLVPLWRLRRVFTGRLRRGSWQLATATGIFGTAVTGAVMWLLLGAQSTNRQQLSGMLDTVTDVLSGQYHGWFTGVRPWVVDITASLAAVTLLATAMVFLASGRSLDRWSAERELHLRELLARYGADDSLGYFNTRRDRCAMFSADGRAAITYRVVGGICLAASDPIGDRSDWPEIILAWRAEARRFGWQPAVLAASETGARAYAAAGMRVLRLGDEAVLDTETFNTRRPELADVRRSSAHARRAGVLVRVRLQSSIAEGERSAIAHAVRTWLKGIPDRGFSMALNRPDDPADGRTVVVTAECAGVLVGILKFVPWGRRAVSLDTMRHADQAPGGVTELMVTELMAAAPRLGIQRVSLNFCMFRGVFAEAERVGGRTVTRLNAGVLGFFDRFWQLERLYRSTRKYDPTWTPRFLCYDDPLTLPRIGLAAAAAEGFLPYPSLIAYPSPIRRPAAASRLERPPEQFPPELLPRIGELDTVLPEVSWVVPRGDQSNRRLATLERAVAAGIDPYPPAERLAVVAVADLRRTGWRSGRTVTVTGRIRSVRDHGGVVFVDLIDNSDAVQVLLEAKRVTDFDRFTTFVDSGDLVRFGGVLGRSRTGTPSVLVESWQLQAKALHPLPWNILGDDRSRLPDRSADLILHPDDLAMLRSRAAAVASIREALVGRGFLEVETPILNIVHGGARARPFRTRIAGSERDLTLRIAPELQLKQLLVAGSGPIFEIGRNFRNEGSDSSHNPEFTALEAYEPGGDYTTMRSLVQQLITAAATAVHGRPVIPLPRRAGDDYPPDRAVELVDVDGDWPVRSVLDAVSSAVGEPVELTDEPERLRRLAARRGVVGLAAGKPDPGTIIEELYSKLVEPATVMPTFFVDFPRSTSPLVRPHRCRSDLVERWDLVAAGMEIATAYTELTDPIDQRRRLTEQSLRAVAGDLEAMEVDEAFLHAIELGMPPTGGLGIGLDRLVMLLTNRPIRGVLAFPFTRPRSH